MREEILNTKVPIIIQKKDKPISSVVYDTYWKFASERQKIFFKRLKKEKYQRYILFLQCCTLLYRL